MTLFVISIPWNDQILLDSYVASSIPAYPSILFDGCCIAGEADARVFHKKRDAGSIGLMDSV